MENLETHNLISGVVADTAPTETAPSPPPSPDGTTEAATEHDNSAGSATQTATPSPSSAEAQSGASLPSPSSTESLSGAEGGDDKTERLLNTVLDRFDDRLRAAEEAGYRRGIAEASRQATADRSVPNFLADIRRDVWE